MNLLVILRAVGVFALVAQLCGAGQSAAAQEAMRKIQGGDFRGANEELESELRRTPRDAELWNLLGISETELGEMRAAEEAFGHGLAVAPQDVSLNENAGLLYFREAEYSEAKRFLALAVAAGSGKPEVEFSLAAARLRSGEQAQARQELLGLESSLGGRPEYWDERGRADLAFEDAAAAGGDFERALALSPRDVTAFNGAAIAAEKQRLDEKALAYLVRARGAGMDDAATLMHFASVCIRLDLGPDAVDALEKAQRLAPSNWEVVYLLGRANLSVSNWQKAFELFQNFSKHDPGFAPAYFAMGWLDIRLNRLDDARSQLRHCLELAPGMADARYELAQLEYDDGKTEQAEQLLRTVLRENPGHAKANVTMGDIFMRRGDLPGAERLLETAVKQDPKLAAAHYKLSVVLQREHRPQEAEAEKQVATKLNEDAAKAGRTQFKLVLPEAAVKSNRPGY